MAHPPLRRATRPLLASYSADSYLVVAGLLDIITSAEGGQQGDPLAAAGFCTPIHAAVVACDQALAAKEGACRFFSDDGYMVGYP